jgi:hypothetical protein
MDWRAVESAATELLNGKENDPTASRELYATTLAQWVAAVEDAPASQQDDAYEQVVLLWIAYANMEKGLRQFKQAVKVFESAATCSVAGVDSRVWLAYVQFCIERNKKSNAKKVYTRAVDAVKAEEEELVWAEFLSHLQVLPLRVHHTILFFLSCSKMAPRHSHWNR